MSETPYTSPELNRQYALGAAAARLFLAGDESYRVLVKSSVPGRRELAAFSQGWQSTGVDAE